MYPGTWAIFVGAALRTGGLDLGSADRPEAIADVGNRPVLLTHGTADSENLPERTEAFAAELRAAGVPTELQCCEGAGHGLVDDICPDDYATWTRDFFTRALVGG